MNWINLDSCSYNPFNFESNIFLKTISKHLEIKKSMEEKIPYISEILFYSTLDKHNSFFSMITQHSAFQGSEILFNVLLIYYFNNPEGLQLQLRLHKLVWKKNLMLMFSMKLLCHKNVFEHIAIIKMDSRHLDSHKFLHKWVLRFSLHIN